MARFVSLVSGKGGVGKTSSAINLAAALTDFGREVILVDADINASNMGILLGYHKPAVSLQECLAGKKKITNAICIHPSGLKVIFSDVALDAHAFTLEHLGEKLRELQNLAEIILIDGAAGLGEEAKAAIKAADDVMIITNPELPAVTDALKTVKIAKDLKKNILGVVITRVKGDHLEMSPTNINQMLQQKVIATIPDDEVMRSLHRIQYPTVVSHPESKVAKAYRKLAANLIGATYEENLPEPKKDLLSTVKDLFIRKNLRKEREERAKKYEKKRA
ncbi:AAA family ATPase [Candidatus Woesearchaeota archaeon]|nr:AAA family ATPase [Candidatus Woesearchaeota archaeon]